MLIYSYLNMLVTFESDPRVALSVIGANMNLENVKSSISPIIEGLGYELVDVEYKTQFGVKALVVYIFKKGGINFDDCIRVDDAITPVLDALDPSDGAQYNLNVSSPGLDRPVVTEDDYRRNMDEELEAVYIKRDADGNKRVHGILVGYDSESFTLSVDGEERKIEKSAIKKLQPYIKF